MLLLLLLGCSLLCTSRPYLGTCQLLLLFVALVTYSCAVTALTSNETQACCSYSCRYLYLALLFLLWLRMGRCHIVFVNDLTAQPSLFFLPSNIALAVPLVGYLLHFSSLAIYVRARELIGW